MQSDDAEDHRPTTATFHALPIFDPPKRRPLQWIDLLFSFKHIKNRVHQVFSSWLASYEGLRPVCDLYLSAAYGDLFLDGKLISLAQAAEVFHRRFRGGVYVDERRFSEELLPALVSGLPSNLPPGLREALGERLRFTNEFSLRKRLKELFAEHHRAIEEFIPRAADVVDAIVKYRNGFTHYTGVADAKPNMYRMIYCVDVLRLLLECCFLKELGFSDEDIWQCARGCQTYRRTFLNRPSACS